MVMMFFISACAGSQTQKMQDAPPVPPQVQEQIPRPMIKEHDPTMKAGLWTRVLYRSLYSDLRASQLGDLVTINIVETSSANKKANTKTGRQSSINAGIDNLLGWETQLKYLTSFGNNDVKNAYDNQNMFNASMANRFDGTGETSRDDSMIASITARVIQVQQDGNLVVRGTRQIKVNNEAQYITLSGIIRPVDISPDNTILSSYVADAQISYSGSGPVSDKQRPGWLMRAVDFVWPF
jgi:flagellar L-ring protein precursor FlgH